MKQQRRNWWKWNKNLFEVKKAGIWPKRSVPSVILNVRQRQKKVNWKLTSLVSVQQWDSLLGVREVFEHAARAALARKKKRKGGCVMI